MYLVITYRGPLGAAGQRAGAHRLKRDFVRIHRPIHLPAGARIGVCVSYRRSIFRKVHAIEFFGFKPVELFSRIR